MVKGDDGLCLVMRKVLITPRYKDAEDWLRYVFQTTCTISRRVCKLIINNESCENIISQEAITKLNLKIETHHHPYKLTWFKKGSEVSVTKQCLVDLSIRNRYFDKV